MLIKSKKIVIDINYVSASQHVTKLINIKIKGEPTELKTNDVRSKDGFA